MAFLRRLIGCRYLEKSPDRVAWHCKKLKKLVNPRVDCKKCPHKRRLFQREKHHRMPNGKLVATR